MILNVILHFKGDIIGIEMHRDSKTGLNELLTPPPIIVSKMWYTTYAMKNHILSLAVIALVLGSFIVVPTAEARGRTGSHRVGGYTSHGKGSHYIGGYVRSGPSLRRHR